MTILTEAEKIAKYDAERAGQLYVKPDMKIPEDLKASIEAQLEEERANPNLAMRQLNGTNGCMSFLVQRYGMEAAAEKVAIIQARDDEAAARDSVLIGHIHTLPVLARYMTDECNADEDDLAAATVVWQGIEISTDGRSYLSLPMEGGFVGDMEIAQWETIKRIAHTDIPEQLIALAQRYPRFRDVQAVAPPVTPPPAIRITHDWLDEKEEINKDGRGQIAYTNYLCGTGDATVEVSFSHLAFEQDNEPQVYMFGRDQLDISHVERVLPSLMTVLGDPRVQALRRGEVLGLEKPAALGITPNYHSLQSPGNFTTTPGGALAWTDFRLGEGEHRVILTVSETAKRTDLVPGMCIGTESVEIGLDDAEQVARNILTIMADPRFKAARGAK